MGLYIPILLLGLLFPRTISLDPEPMGLIMGIFHEILFLTGPPEIILNFLLFIPFFFALLHLVPGLSHPRAALISCLTSASVELAQSQIPGRVSSLRDFISNCVGAIIALAFVTNFSKRKIL